MASSVASCCPAKPGRFVAGEPLRDACAASDSTLYINGIDPGFSGDSLVYTALSLAARATAITVQENFDYGSYDDAGFTGASGFGTSPNHTP